VSWEAFFVRMYFVVLVVSILVIVDAISPRVHAQDAQSALSVKTSTADLAEQLADQVQGWFENLGAQGKVPRVFTGITRDAKQFIIELDGLPFDHIKRREFMIWLTQKFSLVAYAYATRVMKQDIGEERLIEALDIYASSLEKDVSVSFSMARSTEGRITYSRQAYHSEAAKNQPDQIFLGLHRTPKSPDAAGNEEFEKAWAELEPAVYWRGVKTQADQSNPDDPGALTARALQHYASGKCDEAIVLAEKAADLLRKQNRGQTIEFAAALVAQALCRKRLVQVAEAERLYRQAIDIYERVAGSNSGDLAIALDNLAALYSEHDRLPEAEQLRLRALEIFKATLGSSSPHIATTLQNLAVLYHAQGRLPEAELRFLEALKIAEKAYGPESREVSTICDNLAGFYRSQRRFNEAEPFYTRALSIFQNVLGRDHPDTALALQNYAILLSETGRSAEAETNLKEALSINERLYGPAHSTIGAALNTLVLHYIHQNRWSDALAPARLAASISVQLADRTAVIAPSEGGQRSSAHRRLVQVVHGVGADNPDLMNEGFVSAQRALSTDAAAALSQLAARHAIGDGALARLLRERQDLLQQIAADDKLLVAAIARPPDQRDRAAEDRLKDRLAQLADRIDAIDQSLTKQFPSYTELSKSNPVSIAEIQSFLRPDEALLQYLDLQAVGDVPETAFAWLVTKDTAEWVRPPVGTQALARSVAALRCGLDAQRWLDQGEAQCRALLKTDTSSRQWLPFDLNVAFELYQALVAPFAPKIKGKHLLIVPSGPLTGIPLSVLVVEKPDNAFPSMIEGYRNAAWLGTRQPITILPSVGSMKSLRQFAKNSKATKPYLGIGNPLLDGPDATFAVRAQTARANQDCSILSGPRLADLGGRGPRPLQQRGGVAQLSDIRIQVPLPETADELCTVARDFGVPGNDIWLGARATEREIKRISETGGLASYRIVHFATHGALAGELTSGAEPGLILTPPREATQDDDGYLSASEIASLKLDADWVVLSACNTAAGGSDGAEPLSGLARAFFYAGARALLVSHWAVDSDSTVTLIRSAVSTMSSNRTLGRSEALRRSMLTMIQQGELHQAHPVYWSPFIVVGEGAAAEGPLSTSSIAAVPAPQPRAKPRVRPAKKPATSDWRKEIWR
jgi:CHAT domain-containing protein/tetratricopeptide (TPR) repeat protein